MRDTRIQKAMADQGLCSRRQAEQIIQEGRVKLNGRPVQLGDKWISEQISFPLTVRELFLTAKKNTTIT